MKKFCDYLNNTPKIEFVLKRKVLQLTRRVKITRRWKRILYFWKRNPKSAKDINYQ